MYETLLNNLRFFVWHLEDLVAYRKLVFKPDQVDIYSSTRLYAPLCNPSVWEPKFGGFTWGWEAWLVPSGTSQSKAEVASATTQFHWQDPIPLARPKS